MTRLAAGLLVALALMGSATAEELDPRRAVTLATGQTQTLPILDATAAYSLDPGIADIVLQDGIPTIVAIAPGTANVVVVAPAGMQYASVIVQRGNEALSIRTTNGTRESSLETQYDSSSRRVQAVVTAAAQTDDRITSLRLNYALLPRGLAGYPRHMIPAASYRIANRRGEIVFLDDIVRSSPLTLDGQIVRGLHVRRGGLQMHAGYSSFAFFNTLLLSRGRSAVIGVDYRVALNDRSGFTSRLYVFPTRNSSNGGGDGAVVSAGYDYRRGTALQVDTEVSISRSLSGAKRLTPGGYLDISHASDRDSASLRVLIQPDGFAGLTGGVHGVRSDGVWSRVISPRLTSKLSFDANDYRFAAFQQTNENVSLGLRQALSPKWFLSSGARYSRFDSRTSASSVESRELPVGIEHVTPHLTTALEYHYTRSSASDHAGSGARASIRAYSDSTTLDLYLDRTTQVPTLDLIFAENPGLDLALKELGLGATTPSQLARLLREHPELVNFGAIRGVNVNISPVHYELGSSFWWTGKGKRDARVGVNTTYTRDEAPSQTRRFALASINYSVMLTSSLNLGLQYARFASRAGSGAWIGASGWQISFRQQFHDIPSPARLFARRGSIEGIVFVDPDGSGQYDVALRGVAGAEVLLDDGSKAITTADGRFRFERVAVNGAHHVEVRYQSEKPFRFTSAPSVSAQVGKLVTVGIGPIAGHLTVWVRSTEGLAVRNVRISVSDGRNTFVRDVDSGKVAIDLAHGGHYEVSLNADSVPAGYLLADAAPRSVMIEEGHPVEVEFALKAMRSVGGNVRLRDDAGSTLVAGTKVLLDAGVSASVTDSHGTYLFRGVSPGLHVVTAEVAGNQVRREVEVPSTPSGLRDVNLEIQERN